MSANLSKKTRKAFEIIDTNKDGVVTFADFQNLYQSKNEDQLSKFDLDLWW